MCHLAVILPLGYLGINNFLEVLKGVAVFVSSLNEFGVSSYKFISVSGFLIEVLDRDVKEIILWANFT